MGEKSSARASAAAGRVAEARIAFGGMAATPKRARHAERAVAGLGLRAPASWPAAAEALAEDFSPIDDHRASAGYRMRVTKALLVKALTEVAGRPTAQTRITGLRECAHPVTPGAEATPSALNGVHEQADLKQPGRAP